ncbi:hypothetical protein D3C72_2442270 [compost metagenome]
MAAILRRGTLGVLAKQAAEIVAVDKSAGVRHLFHLHVIAFEQVLRLLQPHVIEIFVKPNPTSLLEQMRKVIGRDIKRLGH